ncbi:hypothetical protein ACP6PL_16665 [Dapis sp. BLCC M126]|uniref:hypothetical protein n=1 Tax=Dapis sp. BLCC M126 TaxID=3400189 RepID=UPI003CEDFB58
MAYSDFKTINQAQATFDLSINMVNLFLNIELVEPSEYLKIILKCNLKVAFDNNTEKARSELIIAPLLIEIREIFDGKISLFSGRDFNVDRTYAKTLYIAPTNLGNIAAAIIALHKDSYSNYSTIFEDI